MNHWTKMPKEAYVVLHNGRLVGPAMLKENQLPGVWNITYLVLGQHLEALGAYEGDPAEYPGTFRVTPAVIGTSFQVVDGKTLGQWAEELSPAQWLEKARQVEDLIIEKVYPGSLELASATAAKYNPCKNNNLFTVDFKARRVIR